MVTLDSIIEDLQAELGSSTEHDYYSLLRVMVRGINELHFDVNGHVKRKRLEADTAGNVQLPDDFVKEARVAIVSSSGHLVFLGRNQNIFKPTDNCGTEYQPQPSSSWGISGIDATATQHFRTGEFIGAYYGTGGRSTAGEFRLNREMNRIELSSNLVGGTIILDYIGRAEQINGQFHVHDFLIEPLMRYAMWKTKRWFVSVGEAKALESDYVTAKQWARIRFGGMSREEILEITRRNMTQTPKY